MTELELKQLLSKITRPDETARTAAHAHWASLAKPLGGLGRLETMLEDAAALTGTAELAFSRRAVLVLCADNGVVAQGVSQTDQNVTRAVAENLAARRTSVCQMAKTARCEVVPVDLGMAGEPVPGVQNCRIAAGTADFTTGPAMTRQQAVDAIAAGMGLVRAQKAAGVQLLATGEMGIGNTTTSSAVAAVLLGQPVERMTGRGAGLSDAGLDILAAHVGRRVHMGDEADHGSVLAARRRGDGAHHVAVSVHRDFGHAERLHFVAQGGQQDFLFLGRRERAALLGRLRVVGDVFQESFFEVHGVVLFMALLLWLSSR